MQKWQKDGHLELLRKAPPAFPTAVEEEETSLQIIQSVITSYIGVELRQEK